MRVVHFCSAAALFLALSCCAQDIEGTWQTTVLDHGHFLRYVLHISKPHGAIAATLDVPEHFQFDTPVDSISFDNSILNFRSGQVSYEGSPTGDGQAIQGSWSLTAGKATWQRISPGPKNKVEAVAKRLKSLMNLPEEEWKIHSGDIAQGESIDLDDSSWQIVGPNSTGPHDALWYRRWIEIPKSLNGYDLTGVKVWFDFQDDANGPAMEIVYFNGRRVAMGDDLEPFFLMQQKLATKFWSR
jgi:hypothetical protein